MTNLYEYKHPIINTELAATGVDSEPKKFSTLEAWQDVINDYEFQARCPIILKNSHRNKHFTFACHLKGCPFKILLSYSNNDNYYDTTNASPSNEHLQHQHLSSNLINDPSDVKNDANDINIKKNDDTDNLIDVKVNDSNNNINNNDTGNNIKNNGEDDVERKYSEPDTTDPNVTAAIAAAVAAVQNPNINDSKQNNVSNDSKIGIKDDSNEQKNDDDDKSRSFDVNEMMLTNSTTDNESIIPGPFIVTKIEPYHNHSLEENLSLDKFVLTKIPRILQFDLNFDETLEEIYQKSNHSLSKFKVSQFVEDSGLLDIIKHRYHLVDEDITKKFISLISRRVTTYKARFVLKKKKVGEYRNINPDSFLGHSPGRATSSQQHDNDEKISNDILLANAGHHMGIDHSTSQGATSNSTTKDHTNESEGVHMLGDNAADNVHGAYGNLGDDKAVRAAAQAAIGETINMKRSLKENQDDDNTEDLDRFSSNKRAKLDQTLKNATLDENALVSLDEMHDDKLPHDVAEQLRLLSSHFKDVEAASLQNQSVDNENDNDNEDDNDRVNEADVDDDENKSKDDDISDENIQPELRGQ